MALRELIKTDPGEFIRRVLALFGNGSTALDIVIEIEGRLPDKAEGLKIASRLLKLVQAAAVPGDFVSSFLAAFKDFIREFSDETARQAQLVKAIDVFRSASAQPPCASDLIEVRDCGSEKGLFACSDIPAGTFVTNYPVHYMRMRIRWDEQLLRASSDEQCSFFSVPDKDGPAIPVPDPSVLGDNLLLVAHPYVDAIWASPAIFHDTRLVAHLARCSVDLSILDNVSLPKEPSCTTLIDVFKIAPQRTNCRFVCHTSGFVSLQTVRPVSAGEELRLFSGLGALLRRKFPEQDPGELDRLFFPARGSKQQVVVRGLAKVYGINNLVHNPYKACTCELCCPKKN